MPQSTPLEKIESNDIPDGQASDEERVQRIIHEMNSGDETHAEAPGPQGPPQYQQGPPQYQQQLQQQQQGPPQYHPMPGNPTMGRPMAYQPQYDAPVQQQQPIHVEPPEPVVAKKNIFAHITDALKLPLVVAIVFFLFSLPVVDLYLA